MIRSNFAIKTSIKKKIITLYTYVCAKIRIEWQNFPNCFFFFHFSKLIDALEYLHFFSFGFSFCIFPCLFNFFIFRLPLSLYYCIFMYF